MTRALDTFDQPHKRPPSLVVFRPVGTIADDAARSPRGRFSAETAVTQRYQCIAPDRYLINCLPGEVGAFGGEKARVRVMAAMF